LNKRKGTQMSYRRLDHSALRSRPFRNKAIQRIVLTLFIALLHKPVHASFVAVAGDPIGIPFFTGTFHPDGNSIAAGQGTPGYLNGVSGGSSGGATGQLIIGAAAPGQTSLVAFAIHVTDTAGTSHSLSTLNDPALADVVNDLNHPTLIGTGNPVTVY